MFNSNQLLKSFLIVGVLVVFASLNSYLAEGKETGSDDPIIIHIDRSVPQKKSEPLPKDFTEWEVLINYLKAKKDESKEEGIIPTLIELVRARAELDSLNNVSKERLAEIDVLLVDVVNGEGGQEIAKKEDEIKIIKEAIAEIKNKYGGGAAPSETSTSVVKVFRFKGGKGKSLSPADGSEYNTVLSDVAKALKDGKTVTLKAYGDGGKCGTPEQNETTADERINHIIKGLKAYCSEDEVSKIKVDPPAPWGDDCNPSLRKVEATIQ